MNERHGPARNDCDSPCILPMVGATALPRATKPREPDAPTRLAEVVRGSLDRLRGRLDRVAEGLRETEPARIAAMLDGDRMRRLAGEIDGISQTLIHLGDLLSPAAPAARDVSPRGILEAALARIHRSAGEHALPRIELDVAEGHSVHADPVLVRRALETLLANAIEASGPDGEVVVTSVEYADAIEIEVADSGPGLSGLAKAWLFEPGFSTKTDGTGVALAAAAALVDQLGGTIDAINCPDGGSAFTIRLPHGRRSRSAA